MMVWRWALASVIGTSHVKMGTRKQDALKTATFVDKEGNDILFAIVCDGAGSAQYGGEGASLSCRLLFQSVEQYFSEGAVFPTNVDVWPWIDNVRDALARAAENKGVNRKSFACTLVLLIAQNNRNMIVHIGDGAIVARNQNDEWQALTWPENGEYASSTYFITDDPAPRVRFVEGSEAYTAYALFSDGIEDIALDHKQMLPHIPFFANMMRPLDAMKTSGKDLGLSSALATFLNSERVCERTDDDKSLILLSSM